MARGEPWRLATSARDAPRSSSSNAAARPGAAEGRRYATPSSGTSGGGGPAGAPGREGGHAGRRREIGEHLPRRRRLRALLRREREEPLERPLHVRGLPELEVCAREPVPSVEVTGVSRDGASEVVRGAFELSPAA